MIDLQPSAFSLSPMILVLAFLLDLVIGDPGWLPHPVRIIGSAISRTETFLRRYFQTPVQERFGGIILVLIIVVSVFVVIFLVYKELLYFLRPSGLRFLVLSAVILLIYLTSTTIAVRELIHSARLVIESVKNKDMDSAKNNLAMIVGRDTQHLSEKGILRATIETLSENLSDGIIAPLFYLTIGGLPLAVTYKAINTLDSMVGYKNGKYINFGWAAARLDDIANYIPARLTGLLIIASAFIITLCKDTRNSLPVIRFAAGTMLSDGRRHLSPNSGIPEAAMAGAVGVRLGGPSTYDCIVVQKPFIGVERESDYLSSSQKTIHVVRMASVLGIVISSTILYVRNSVWI